MTTVRVPGTPGVELAVRLTGDAAAPPLVLLHALGETSQSWAPVLSAFADRHLVAAFDLRGHGASDWPGSYSSELMRDDVVAAVDALGFTTFTLIGHSLGGVVALLVAEQLTERVSRLVIEDAVPPYPREPRPVPERPDDVLPFDWALLEATYAEMTDAEMRHWPALSAITAPTLVLGGGPSSHVPAERIEQMARLIPQCEVRTIEAGHHIHESAPAEFAAVVASWLATSDPAR